MELLLIKEDLWHVVSGNEPVDRDSVWIGKDNKAKAMIGLTLDDSQLVHIKKLKTAKEYWEALKKYHEKATLSNKVVLMKKLCRMKMDEGGNVEEHLNFLLDLVDKLTLIGEHLNDSLVVAFILSSLPESYDTIVMALETRPESELSVEGVKHRLVEECTRRKEASDNTSQMIMKAGSKFKTNKTCFYCHQRGHFRDECKFYKQEKMRRQNSKENNFGNKNEDETIEKGNKNKVRQNSKLKQNVKFIESQDHVCLQLKDVAMEKFWYIDSGATTHMTSNKYFFDKINFNIKENICMADGSEIKSKGKGCGTIKIPNRNEEISKLELENVLYIPELNSSILSVGKLTEKGLTVVFEKTRCNILDGGAVIGTAFCKNNLFILNVEEVSKNKIKLTKGIKVVKGDINLWHRRFGHRDPNALNRLINNDLAKGITITGNDVDKCEVCILGKSCKRPFPKYSEIKSKEILDLVHSDICGPIEPATPRGNKYILTLIDDYSRYTHIYLLKSKAEVAEKYIEFAELMKTKFNKNIKVLRSDNGGEYIGRELNNYLRSNGTVHQYTAPYCPQQNGVAERKNRSLVEMANCMLIEAQMEKKFWGEAVNTSCYLQNRLPTSAHGKTPHELWYKRKPNLNYVKTFGCAAFANIPSVKRKKFGRRAIELKLVGYCEASKAYRLLDAKTCQIYISRDVKFIENSSEIRNAEVSKFSTKETTAEVEVRLSDKNQKTDEKADKNIEVEEEIEKEEEVEVNEQAFEKFEDDSPQTYNDVLRLPDRRKWITAMREELESMQKLEVWKLVERPKTKRVIQCRWVFKVKEDPTTYTKRYKARVVARGYSQKYGEDYDEVFAPVVKQSTIRILLTISGLRNYSVKHLDVKTAFLNGELEEDVYMEQPEGFKCKGKEDWVCKLKKSIYGLKQAARAWNIKIDSTLLKLGFRKGLVDPCLYTKEVKGKTLYVLVYVDDIIMACEDEELISETEKLLNEEFEIKSMGELKYYLGLEIERANDGTFKIHQRNYIEKLLERFNLKECKTSKIPLDTGYYKNLGNASKPIKNKEVYRTAIGSLLYLAGWTRPDIAVSVSILSRKVSCPTEQDWTEVKRIFKYLKGTMNLKLNMGVEPEMDSLVCYSDADWAGDAVDRKSTSGNVILLHGSPISWMSKKQTCVSLSSTEAEYIALTEACKDILSVREILKEIKEEPSKIIVYEDNQSVLKIIDSEKFKGTKHIEVKYHFIKNLKKSEEIEFKYCASEEMVADILTKPLNSIKIALLRQGVGLH